VTAADGRFTCDHGSTIGPVLPPIFAGSPTACSMLASTSMGYTSSYQVVIIMAPLFKSPVKMRAKVFRNGRSQAVRLPKDFRFAGDEVSIRRDGDAVILEPIKRRSWPRGYWERLAELRLDFDVEPMSPKLEEVDLER
jgi:antitoxin VapB